MRLKYKNILGYISGLILMLSCAPAVDISQVDFDNPPTIIYKVADEYLNLVPVVLNEDKTKIVAYPAPENMYDPNGELRLPIPLEKGFFLDQIGVGLNTAYTSLTITEYSKMPSPPSLDSLFMLIVDDDPFKKMYNLGNRKQYLQVEVVKELVSSGKYKSYKRLK